MTLLTAGDVARLKPLFSVRDADRFTRQLVLWSVLFLCCFFGVHLYWTLRGVEGPQYLLPAVQLLTGIGMALMVTLRDPLRDTLAFANFAGTPALRRVKTIFTSGWGVGVARPS